MNSKVMPSVVQMERKELKEWVTEVKETLATDHSLPQIAKSKFGIVDLWNIQRKMKSADRPFNRKRNKIKGYIYP